MDREKLRQAVQEFGWTFIALFGASFVAFLTGWTTLPNLGELRSALYAAFGSAIAGAAKGVLFYFTGTKAVSH